MNDFQLDNAVVRPRRNEIELDGRSERLSSKFIDVLVVLAERPGQVIGKAELLKRVWNDPLIGDEALAHAVWMLRKTLNDPAKRPRFIETIPRRGYRLIAQVRNVEQVQAAAPLALPELEAPSAVIANEIAPPSVSHSLPAMRPTRARLGLYALGLILAVALLGAARWVAHDAPPQVALLAFRSGGAVSTLAPLTNGALLVANQPGTLYAVDALSGVERWRFVGGARPMLAPAADPTRIFLGSDDGYVYAIDTATGRELWRHAAGCPVQTAPLLLQERVIFGNCRGQLSALDSSDGRVLWQVKLDSRALGSILDSGGMLVLRTLNGAILALDPLDGRVHWQRRFSGPLSDLVALAANQVVIASDAGFVVALDTQDGTTLWQADLPGAEATPWVDAGRVFAVGRYGSVVALRGRDGATLWRSEIELGDGHRPQYWNGRVVVPLDGGALGLLDAATGRLTQRIELFEQLDAYASDGARLLVATRSGRVFSLDRASLDGLHNDLLALEMDGQLRAAPANEARRPRYAVEPLAESVALPRLLWRSKVLGHVQDVALAADARVFLADEHSALALGADGAPLWQSTLRPALGTQPALDEQRMVFGRRDRYVYALDPTSGKQLWRFATGAQVIAPPILALGRVYVGSDDGRLYALDAGDGRMLWSFQTERSVRGAAAVADGKVIFGSADRHVYALDAHSGKLLWKYLAEDWVVAYPLIVQRRVLIGVGNGDFLALDADSGAALWRFRSAGRVWFRAAADAERVYFGSGDGHIYALALADGVERWRYKTGADAEGSVVLAGGVLYAGSHDAHLYALDSASGKALWRLRTGGAVLNPAIAGDRLVVASADQHVYTLDL